MTMVTPRNLVVTGTSSFRIDFDVSVGNDRIQSIAGGGAVDDFNYLMIYDSTGETREFTFDFTDLKKTIVATSTLNIIIRIMDVDGIVYDWTLSKQNGVEAGYSLVSSPKIIPRTDGSDLIDIFYDYSSPLEIDPATVAVSISDDGGLTWNVLTTSATGDVGTGIAVGPNRRITWNPVIDMPDGGEVVVEISLSSLFGGQAIGQFQTGTLVVSKPKTTAPVVRITGTTKPKYAVKGGNLYKNNSFDFIPYESSSESSGSSQSSLSSLSTTSLSTNSSNSSQSFSSQSSVSSLSSSSISSLSSSSISSLSSSSVSSSSVSSESSSLSSVSSVSSASSVSSLSSSSTEMMTSSSVSGPESYYFSASGFGEGDGYYYYNGVWAGGSEIPKYTNSTGYSIQLQGLKMSIWQHIAPGASIAKYYSSNYTVAFSFGSFKSPGYPAGALPTGNVTANHMP